MIEQEPQVLQCFRVTGSYNFIIKVSCTDIDALEHLLTKMQKMGSTNTQIILNTQLDRGSGIRRISEVFMAHFLQNCGLLTAPYDERC